MSAASLGYDGVDVPVLRCALLTVTVLCLHVAFVGRLAAFGVHPETLLVLAVVGGIELGPSAGALLGFGSGFANDLLASTPLGLWALIGAAIAVLAGEASRRAFVGVRDQLPVFLVIGCVSGALIAYTVLGYVIAEHPIPQVQRLTMILVVSLAWSAALTVPMRFVVLRALGLAKR